MDGIDKMKRNILEDLYRTLQVSKERKSCPRPGIYKVINIYKGKCYERPALMAKCNWRATIENDYQIDFEIDIQLESFKKNATKEQLRLLNSQELKGREIDVFAVQDMGKQGLDVKWKFVEQGKIDLDKLNGLLSSGALGDFNLNQLDSSGIDDSDIDFVEDI